MNSFSCIVFFFFKTKHFHFNYTICQGSLKENFHQRYVSLLKISTKIPKINVTRMLFSNYMDLRLILVLVNYLSHYRIFNQNSNENSVKFGFQARAQEKMTNPLCCHSKIGHTLTT